MAAVPSPVRVRVRTDDCGTDRSAGEDKQEVRNGLAEQNSMLAVC